jgi:hypothetical protein
MSNAAADARPDRRTLIAIASLAQVAAVSRR